MRPRLDDLAIFLAIAEQGSFRRAAALLDLSPSALSHAMRALETRLGARLLNRTTRSVGLTDAGARLAERLRPALFSVDSAIAELRDETGQLSGCIRITTTEHGAVLLLDRGIAEFQERHPLVEIELAVDAALVDLTTGGFDAGVRFRDDVPLDMVAIPISPHAALAAVAAPAYLAAHPLPERPADLMQHRCIRQRFANGRVYRWEFEDEGRVVTIEPHGMLVSNSLPAIVAATVRGAGICYVPMHHVAAQLASGQLVRLLEDYSLTFDGPCFYYLPSRHPTRAFTAFVDHLRNTCASQLWS
ncbi:LysR family transcriptional regulator [Azospirillum sp. B4]|uniref:LysR family transcriptional regulator n=1 Tax=Azospirillum sp. B4 TaxID=95605 RepID=UPI0005C855F2|nr:LysR family transcriptional regulator [Azospirillum sp. B4]